ncbi:MAG: hypothetical protein IJ443_03715 [Firmicutes bacterium]|nr:hypothetical protein [Bacillota bacterium]
MHDPGILILDEPTSGLEPMMQQKFIDFIRTEKQRGKTILLSSHIFHEVDATCDRISIIKDGRIVTDFLADELKHAAKRIYLVSFGCREDYDAFCALDYEVAGRVPEKNQLRLCLEDGETDRLIADLACHSVTDLQPRIFAEVASPFCAKYQM